MLCGMDTVAALAAVRANDARALLRALGPPPHAAAALRAAAGRTLLHEASALGALACAQALMTAGFPVVRDAKGELPVDLACRDVTAPRGAAELWALYMRSALLPPPPPMEGPGEGRIVIRVHDTAEVHAADPSAPLVDSSWVALSGSSGGGSGGGGGGGGRAGPQRAPGQRGSPSRGDGGGGRGGGGGVGGGRRAEVRTAAATAAAAAGPTAPPHATREEEWVTVVGRRARWQR